MSERQMATTLEEVRLDHRTRYEFAVAELQRRGRLGQSGEAKGHVIDAGCGVGYGSSMLAEYAERVTSVEISREAHELYQRHWSRPNIDFQLADLTMFEVPEKVDAVVCFEFIEHIEDYMSALRQFSTWSDLLIISTPNEAVRPHLQEPVNPFHHRHFTPEELSECLSECGLHVHSWHCQRNGSKPQLLDGTNGKFIVAVASSEPVESKASVRLAS